jgi:MSHA biogenesis protein MshQ
MNRLIKHVLINLLGVLILFAGDAQATVRKLNNGGGTDSSNGLEINMADTTQMQIKRLGTGQLYQPGTYPTGSYPYNSLLDNGVYIRYNNRMYGANHFAYSAATIYNSFNISAVTPANTSQGVTQSTTTSFALTSAALSSPAVSIVWKYTYPLDYVTAEVTVTIPVLATVSASNPIRYYHAVDTYLGGNDNGCGVRYTDSNGKRVVGTYPLTNGTCPSSNSLPPNLDVVESFRERTGTFDHYCVGFWSDFWSTSTTNPPACAISKSGSLSDSITTTYQDTGAAIEFDFTAPGIYTFSYDFVVGSTFVPDYDHFEIRHAGTATLCPTEVKVLACLSSTVPCPDNQLVSSGELKGSLTVSPTTPTVTDTPDPFTLGSNQSIGTVTMQGSAAATYTLGVSGLTKAPLSGVKCWNTATSSQSCSFTFTNTPCVNTFECMESGLTYNNLSAVTNKRNPIYTKLTRRAFNLDVYALLTSGVQATAYVSAANGVTVELVNDTGSGCGTTVVATKKISFSSSSTNPGKQTVSFSDTDVLNSYPSLRCRVTDTSVGKVGCSTDNFSVRPQSFTVTSSNATPASPGPTATPVFVAGTSTFNLKAVTGESNYTGTPKAVPVAHSGATAAGVISYTVGVGVNAQTITGTLPAAISGVITADNFSYSEVGLFQFPASATSGVYDNTFTAVDQANGDCDTATVDNTGGSGTVKFYGCTIGSTSGYFGRFIPQRFDISTGTVTKACGTFAYYGQDTTSQAALDTQFTITAKNGLGATTQNYVGSYAKFDPSNWGNFNFTTNPALTTVALTRSTANNSLTGSWAAGVAPMTAKFYVPRANTPINEQIVTVRTQIQDSDGVTTTTSPFPIASTVPFRYGRLAITPVHGSELLPLTVPLEAQFWGGTGYRRSTDDSCTTFDIKTIAMRNYRGNLNACETVLSGSTPISIIQGKASLRLSAPGVSGNTPNTGSVDLGVNFDSITAGDQTCVGPGTTQSNAIAGTAGMRNWFGADPLGRATFGVYKAPIIYMRENFQ